MINNNDVQVAVVGAGMSGLIAARELSRQGVDVLVLEAADRVGGRTLTETSALGSTLDLGGQWIGYGHHRFEALADELGATRFEMRSPKSPALLDGERVVPMASSTMALAGAALAGMAALSHLPSRNRWNTTTLDQWLVRVPSDDARRLLDVLAVVSSTADPDRISVQAFLSFIAYQGGLSTMLKTRGGAQHALVAEGAGALAQRLAAQLGDRVRTAARVTSITQNDNDVTIGTATDTVRADRVVVTVPPPLLAGIDFHPGLPAEHAALQQNTYMGSVYKAIAVYDRPFWRDHTDAESIHLDDPAAAVFDASPPGGPGHLCFLIGGPQARAVDKLEPAARRSALLNRLARRLGPQVLEPVSWHEKSWHLDPFVGGGYIALPEPGTTDGFYPHASTSTGHIHWAGSETAAEHAGYLEVSIAAGERAAGEVVEALRG